MGEVMADHWDEAYKQGQQDMLAKCIHGLESLHKEMRNWSSEETEAVLAVYPELTAEQWVWAQRGVDRAIADLRALRENP